MTLQGRHSHLHPLLKIAEWLLLMLVCMPVMFVIWRALPIAHNSTGSLLLFQALQSLGLFIVPALLVGYLWGNERLSVTGFRLPGTGYGRPGAGRGLLSLLCVAIILTAIPLINCLVACNEAIRLPEAWSAVEQMMQQMEQQAAALLKSFMDYGDGAWWALLLNLVVLAILPAIGEELAFRGVLQGLIMGDRPSVARRHVAVWVTAFVFSFIHFQFYGFIPRMLLGALLGYVMLWSGHIGYSMLMHATNNALSVIIYYLGTYVWSFTQDEMDALGTGDTWWLTVVCTSLMAVLVYVFARLSSRSPHNP